MTQLTDSFETYHQRSEVTKAIKRNLKSLTGLTWSVTGGKGTGYSWLTIMSPKARRVAHIVNPAYDQNKMSFEQEDVLPYIEVEPSEENGGWYMSREDRLILVEAMGLSMNRVTMQGISISPDSWNFYLYRSYHGAPEEVVEETVDVEEIEIVELPPMPEDVELVEFTGGKDIMVTFPRLNKMSHIDEYTSQLDGDDEKVYVERSRVSHLARMTNEQFDNFTQGNLLSGADWFISGLGGQSSDNNHLVDQSVDYVWNLTEADKKLWQEGAYTNVIMVTAPDRSPIFLNPEGHKYARYVGFADDISDESDLIETSEVETDKAGRFGLINAMVCPDCRHSLDQFSGYCDECHTVPALVPRS